MQHSKHVGQHDGTPHDGALSAQRNRYLVHNNEEQTYHTARRKSNKTKKMFKKVLKKVF